MNSQADFVAAQINAASDDLARLLLDIGGGPVDRCRRLLEALADAAYRSHSLYGVKTSQAFLDAVCELQRKYSLTLADDIDDELRRAA